ncbi:MAG: hypothetical protein CSA26_00695 [Desulfobacterales bacterium]|nr:MAG: hypothetical protein CSA26_00695 [Desulfobacterales bacterium]
MKTTYYIPLPLVVLIFFFSVFTSSAFAHKIRIFAWDEGDIVHTESKFSGGKAARKAEVNVIDKASGQIVISGITDYKGNFSFSFKDYQIQPHPGQLFKIRVNSGDGHVNSWIYEIPPSTTNRKESQPHPQEALPSQAATVTQLPQTVISQKKLEQILEQKLNEKLAPIQKSIAESLNPDPTLQDILGGIGYLIGIAGIIAYMKSKK